MKTRKLVDGQGITMRGLTEGSVSVGVLEEKRWCMVIGDSFPSWLLHVGGLGFEVVQIVLRNLKQGWFMNDDIFSAASASIKDFYWDLPIEQMCWGPWYGKKDAVCFVDGRATKDILDMALKVGISEIISTKRPRRDFEGWTSLLVVVPHSAVGGITEALVTIVRHSQSVIPAKPQDFPSTIPRDASTVLSHATFARFHRKQPSEVYLDPVRCVNLGSILHPYYHGHGYLPGNIDKTTRVLTPVLNPPHRDFWGLRHLSLEEILAAKDVSELALKVGKDKEQHFGSKGGKRGEEPQVNGDGDESIRTATTAASTTFTIETGEIGIESDDWTLTGIPNSLDGAPSLKEDVAREAREKKATKADDAAVPEYLWFEHMAVDRLEVYSEKQKWAAGVLAPGMKRKMLLWWKNSLCKTFISWLYKKHPKLQTITQRAGSVVEWIPNQEVVDDTGATEIIPGKYRWHESKKGEFRYRQWWLERFSLCPRDFVAGQDAIIRAFRSTWREWEDGSCPFHWRWVEEYQDRIRDGIPVHFLTPFKRYTVAQKDEKDPEMKPRIVKKLQKVRARRYVAPGHVDSLTSFFGVKKGLTDIRMVYDGSVSGLNDAIRMPRFVLPTIRSHLRAVEAGTYMCDVDVGEMFLNFVLHDSLQKYAGVDLTLYAPESDGSRIWECWHRAAMGLTSSPYQACQGMGFAEEVIRGDRLDPRNVFRWDRVRQNLPGCITYNPEKPWVSKIRDDDLQIAADFVTFVDDARPTGSSSQEAWRAARIIASTFSFLGLQDAPRKRRNSSQRPGAWTGSVLRTDEAQVRLMVGEDKWEKAKALIEELLELVRRAPRALPRKRLEQIRGYLVHIAQTYPMLSSYLIGVHMTIDEWRPNRDRDGWRFSTAYIQGMKDGGDWPEDYDSANGPDLVSAVPRLYHDIKAMQQLLSGSEPLERRVRGRKTCQVMYGFADASKSSLGSTIASYGATVEIEGEANYRYGQWSEEIVEDESSNWKELGNLVFMLEDLAAKKVISGAEIFMFTDNSTAESAFWKGTSTSPRLFALVLRLKKLELDHDLILHVTHVSGKRMIYQGTDRLSRADHSQGVMGGRRMLDFVPLHLSALERESKVLPWLKAVTRGLNPTFLTPEGWFTTGHGLGTFVWNVAPAAAEVVVEQIGLARLKRPESMHIVVVPRVMTGRWRRLMTRGSDAYLKIDWEDVWSLSAHYEPLLIFVCMPYRTAAPRLKEQEELLVKFLGTVLQEDLYKIPDGRKRHLLRKFLLAARALCPL